MTDSVIGNCFAQLENWLSSFSIEAFSSILQKQWFDEILERTNRNSQRVRKLVAHFVMWLVVALSFYRNLSIQNVLKKLGNVFGVGSLWKGGKIPGSPATVEARDRLGVAPMLLLARKLSSWLFDKFKEQMKWRGLTLVAVDGATLKMPDTPANEAFGRPGASRGRAAFPQMRGVFLVSTVFHFILGQIMGPYRKGEVPLVLMLLRQIPENALVLLDRGFLAWQLLIQICQRGGHFLVRAKSNVHGRVIKALGKGDRLIEVTLPRALRRSFPELPKFVIVREISALIKGKRFRFFTSLLDASAYPAAELVACYYKRWEEEISIDEIKTHQCGATTVNRPVIFRSKSPRRVFQEAYGLIIAYNLVRAIMAEAAQRYDVEPLRISFTDSLERIRDAAICMAAAPTIRLPEIYEQLLFSLAQFPLPKRRVRSNRREVCVKMSKFPLKMKKIKRRRAS